MASKTDTSTAGRSDPSTVSAAALRLDPLLRKIRDGLSQYLEAFALAIQGARRQDIKWPLFTWLVPDPGDGGTIHFVEHEPGDFVNIDKFGICELNIPVSEADIETGASYLQICGLDPDAQRLLDVFKELKAAFCSVGEFVQLTVSFRKNRKFYARDLALMLAEHLEDLIGTLPTIVTGGSVESDGPEPPSKFRWKGKVAELTPTPYRLVEFLYAQRNRTADKYAVCVAIWDDEEAAKSGLPSARTHANNAFLAAEMAVNVTIKGNFVTLTLSE